MKMESERWMKGSRDELNIPGEALRGKRRSSFDEEKQSVEVMRREHKGAGKMDLPCGCTLKHYST